MFNDLNEFSHENSSFRVALVLSDVNGFVFRGPPNRENPQNGEHRMEKIRSAFTGTTSNRFYSTITTEKLP